MKPTILSVSYSLLTTLLLLATAGCSTKAGHPISYYTLQPASPSSITEHTRLQTDRFKKRTLQVTIPESTRQIRTRKIHYTQIPYAREAYAYHLWSDTPNTLIAAYLRAYLDQSGLFKAVVGADSRAGSDFLLESYIDAFYQWFKTRTDAYAVVKMHFLLIDRSSKKVISAYRFSTQVPSPSANAEGGVAAFNKATERMGSELVRWLSQIPLKKH